MQSDSCEENQVQITASESWDVANQVALTEGMSEGLRRQLVATTFQTRVLSFPLSVEDDYKEDDSIDGNLVCWVLCTANNFIFGTKKVASAEQEILSAKSTVLNLFVANKTWSANREVEDLVKMKRGLMFDFEKGVLWLWLNLTIEWKAGTGS